jgi:two-component sensor histidine kinase
MLAKTHSNEKQRLDVLQAFEILDTSAEKAFDDLTSLSAEICETPICLISLVDSNRQWFKSEVGLGISETPLEKSICAHAVSQDDYLEISDTQADPRTVDNKLCIGVKPLRFYAGAILRAANGLPVGTLCVLDYKPRFLSPLQRKTLQVHADHIIKLMELRVAIKNEEVLRNEVDHRVKNSLQMVSSLIRLTRIKTKPENADEGFRDIERRVDGIAQLHRALNRATEIETVALDRFIMNVLQHLQQSAPDNVKIVCNLSNMKVGSMEASAVATIISEFVANSIKHAFPERRAGVIRVFGALQHDGSIAFTCSDNGIGKQAVEKGQKEKDEESLGTKLMKASASQIGASFKQVSSSSGFIQSFSFKPTMETDLEGCEIVPIQTEIAKKVVNG